MNPLRMITDEVYAAFLKCKHKGYLKLMGVSGEESDYERLQDRLTADYRAAAREELLKDRRRNVLESPGSFSEAVHSGVSLVTDVTVGDAGEVCRLDALEKIESGQPRASGSYRPVLFARGEKVATGDRLLLAFGASLMARVQGTPPSTGRIIHGRGFRASRVELAPLLERAQQVTGEIRALREATKPPPLLLNRHCPECEFRPRCRAAAVEKDDLSLLGGLSAKETAALNARGIFTVTQYSHTFRPGTARRKRAGGGRKHQHSLQALAVREGTTYVVEKPGLPSAGVRLYLDVEGLPDRDFYYLIGLVIEDGQAGREFSFWADRQEDEALIWYSLLRAVASVSDFVLFHYGGYESQFMRKMTQRHGGDPKLLGKMEANAVNVLSRIYSRVYLPVYANDLKSVASYLGFKWTAEGPSGLRAVVWRHEWEATRDERLRERLVTYNREDCVALQRVVAFLTAVEADAWGGKDTVGRIAAVEDVKQESSRTFGKSHYFFPELAHITKCSYFDYQRKRVLFRTSPLVKKCVRQQAARRKKVYRANRVVACSVPGRCPRCQGGHLKAGNRYTRAVLDLKLSRGGVKRWVTRYTTRGYKCDECKAPFLPDDYVAISATKYGHNLCVWAVYGTIALRQTNENVADNLSDLFGYSVSPGTISDFRKRAAEYYRPTYMALLERLRSGPLVHADETKVGMRERRRSRRQSEADERTGKVPGRSTNSYVWAFASPETVVYVYAPTRDGKTVRDTLQGFQGVLVSDFYTAYDSLPCPQQKCLVHLARDFNDDLFKHPFDEELKQLAHRFTLLLQGIVETIDRYGLKRLHLAKHRRDVDRFYSQLSGAEYRSELAEHYQKRLTKYRGKLFTFLDHDGVPWNNNNGENAIKRFAALRQVLGTAFTEDGIKDYLVLLSISQTLRYRGGSFWRFLLSRETDLDAIPTRGR